MVKNIYWESIWMEYVVLLLLLLSEKENENMKLLFIVYVMNNDLF